MTEVIEGLEAISIHIQEPNRSRKFFGEVLGLKEVSFSPEGQRIVYSIPGTSTLLSMHVQREGEGGREPGTVSGIIFSHSDPVQACAEIRRRGGTIVDEPRTFQAVMGKVTLGVFSDPDGNQFVIRRVQS